MLCSLQSARRPFLGPVKADAQAMQLAKLEARAERSGIREPSKTVASQAEEDEDEEEEAEEGSLPEPAKRIVNTRDVELWSLGPHVISWLPTGRGAGAAAVPASTHPRPGQGYQIPWSAWLQV